MTKKFKEAKSYSKKAQSIFVSGFLEIASISLKELKKKKNIGKVKWYGKSFYLLKYKGLWVAVVWNIKHAIELIIKTLGIRINKKYFKKHDLEFLINDLEKKLHGKARKVNINRIKRIVKKYYKNEIFVGKKITDSVDLQNDIFRYTDNSANTDINFKVFDQLTRQDISRVEKDIKFLDDLFYNMETEIQSISNMRKWGMSKSQINQILRKQQK